MHVLKGIGKVGRMLQLDFYFLFVFSNKPQFSMACLNKSLVLWTHVCQILCRTAAASYLCDMTIKNEVVGARVGSQLKKVHRYKLDQERNVKDNHRIEDNRQLKVLCRHLEKK